jgi:hypothetical protein
MQFNLNAEVIPGVSVGDVLRDHHHLITPTLYSPGEIKTRDLALMKRNWPKSVA